MIGITIGEKHTWKDFGLKWSSVKVGMPSAKTNMIDTPGGDGMLDLTEALNGRVRYGTRTLEFGFDLPDRNFEAWSVKVSQIASYIHGQKLKFILDTDPGYFYYGRAEIDMAKSDREGSTVTIKVTADPYKYELASSTEDWLWDTLNFETGSVRETSGIVVDGTAEITIPETRRPVVPKFKCSAAMTVTFKGTDYQLPAGESENVFIEFYEEVTLTLKGTGTVSIEYQGGVL